MKAPPDLFNDLVENPPPENTKREAKRRRPHLGSPVSWAKRIYPVARSKGELLVGFYLYRLRSVNSSKTVEVGNKWLREEFGIDRFTKYRALARYAKAGLIQVRRRGKAGKGAPQIRFLV
jgi:hypothetical protein